MGGQSWEQLIIIKATHYKNWASLDSNSATIYSVVNVACGG
jgi:hypothetical protein